MNSQEVSKIRISPPVVMGLLSFQVLKDLTFVRIEDDVGMPRLLIGRH